jgi:hypothetical protein
MTGRVAELDRSIFSGYFSRFMACLFGGSGIHAPDQSATGHFNHQILASGAIHAFAHAALAVGCDQSGLIKLSDEIIEVVVRLENHVAAATAVPAARTAFGHERFAMKRDCTLAAVSGARENLDLINKHLTQGSTTLARPNVTSWQIKKARPGRTSP